MAEISLPRLRGSAGWGPRFLSPACGGGQGGGLRLKTEAEFVPPPDGGATGAPHHGSMTDPESAYRLIAAELALRRAPALHRASLAWDAELDAQGIAEDCCASGDYDDAA